MGHSDLVSREIASLPENDVSFAMTVRENDGSFAMTVSWVRNDGFLGKMPSLARRGLGAFFDREQAVSGE